MPSSAVPQRQVFRSPFAVVAWWVWALFAAANLIDLAVQGRDRLSLLAALGVLLVTGIVYAVALRPRITATDECLLIANPLRDHRIGWAAVATADAAELVRVHCSWPRGGPPEAGDGTRVIYAWAVHSSRRRQAAARLRADRRRGGASGSNSGFGIFGGDNRWPAPGAPGFRAGGPGLRDSGGANAAGAGDPSSMNAEDVAAELAERAEAARVPDAPAGVPPVSTWHWPSVVAIVIPAIALAVAALT